MHCRKEPCSPESNHHFTINNFHITNQINMRYTKLAFTSLLAASALVWACQSGNKDENRPSETLVKAAMTRDEMIAHGQLLITAGGCNDCHSPKSMGPHGPAVDSSKLLSGHPANMPTPPITADALKPGNWVLMGPDVTTFVGPWGIS